MKKLIGIIFLFLSFMTMSDQRPSYIQSLESQIARENDRDKAAVLLKEYEKYFKSYINSISNNENQIFYLGDRKSVV